MDKRKGPLKKVVKEWYEGDYLKVELECGHIFFAPTDKAGAYNAEKRRCWKCAKENIER